MLCAVFCPASASAKADAQAGDSLDTQQGREWIQPPVYFFLTQCVGGVCIILSLCRCWGVMRGDPSSNKALHCTALAKAPPAPNQHSGFAWASKMTLPFYSTFLAGPLQGRAPHRMNPPAFLEKIVARQDARARLADLPRPVVFTNGVFDVLHCGHATYLAQARQLGGSLVVALNTDASARRLGKGPDRPLNREEDRAVLMAAL